MAVARYQDRLGVALLGVTPAGPSVETAYRVADLMVAGLADDATFPGTAQSPSPGGWVSATDFAAAIAGGWDTAWSATRGDNNIGAIPCVTGWPGPHGGAGSTSLGGNGDQEYGTFDSTTHAKAAFDRLRAALADCAGSSYTLGVPDRVNGLPSFAATGAEVVWAVQQGRQVGVVTVPGSGTAPPVQVSVAVVVAISSAIKES
jgi:hypothetical protein